MCTQGEASHNTSTFYFCLYTSIHIFDYATNFLNFSSPCVKHDEDDPGFVVNIFSRATLCEALLPIQKEADMLGVKLRELKTVPMSRVWIYNQLSIEQSLAHEKAVVCRHHEVCLPTCDEHRHPDLSEPLVKP